MSQLYGVDWIKLGNTFKKLPLKSCLLARAYAQFSSRGYAVLYDSIASLPLHILLQLI